VEVGVARKYEYRVFISHVWRIHSPNYDGLIRLLTKAKRFDYRELGVPQRRKIDGKAPMEQILEIVRTSDVVLVINTPVVGNSDNVLKELEEAVKYGIPIIAVTPKGKRPSQHPFIERHAKRAAWIGNSIVAAIRDEVKKARRLKAATVTEEVTLTADNAYETVEEAAEEVHLSPAELEEVRGEDEIMEAPHQPTQIDLPKDVILKDGPDLSSSGSGPASSGQAQSPSSRSFISRLFGRH
jgi:hypothetical protein